MKLRNLPSFRAIRKVNIWSYIDDDEHDSTITRLILHRLLVYLYSVVIVFYESYNLFYNTPKQSVCNNSDMHWNKSANYWFGNL